MTGGPEALTWEEKGIGFGSEPLQLSGISSGNQTNQTVAPAKTVWSCVVSISSETIMRVLMKDISNVRESEVSKQNNKLCFIHFAHIPTIEKFTAFVEHHVS